MGVEWDKNIPNRLLSIDIVIPIIFYGQTVSSSWPGQLLPQSFQVLMEAKPVIFNLVIPNDFSWFCFVILYLLLYVSDELN